ncbi:MAG: VOC family protein [Chloroflexi bacterium]|nr:VOC family protein [Chloroflexota bacterium]
MVNIWAGSVVAEINIVVRNLDQAVEDYKKMGFRELYRGGNLEPPVQSRWSNMGFGGNTMITIMESTEPGSPIDRFIEKKGEGLFSISFKIPDMDRVVEGLKAAGCQLVLDKPAEEENSIIFATNYKKLRNNYVKPRGPTHGVVFELDELDKTADYRPDR